MLQSVFIQHRRTLLLLVLWLCAALLPQQAEAQTVPTGYVDWYMDFPTLPGASRASRYPTITGTLNYYIGHFDSSGNIHDDFIGSRPVVCPKEGTFTYACSLPDMSQLAEDVAGGTLDFSGGSGVRPLSMQFGMNFAGPKGAKLNILSAARDAVSFYSVDLDNDLLNLSVSPPASNESYAQAWLPKGFSKPFVGVFAGAPDVSGSYTLRITVGAPGIYDLTSAQIDPGKPSHAH